MANERSFTGSNSGKEYGWRFEQWTDNRGKVKETQPRNPWQINRATIRIWEKDENGEQVGSAAYRTIGGPFEEFLDIEEILDFIVESPDSESPLSTAR